MVDKFVDSTGKTVITISDENDEVIDPIIKLKDDGSSYVYCNDCKYGVLGVFTDTRSDECPDCGSKNIHWYKRVCGKVYEIKEDTQYD